MDISVVILTWESENYIEKCISSLMAGFKGPQLTYEIFLIDNGSRDRTVSIIEKFRVMYPDIIKPLYLKENTGTTYSRNLALKKADGEYIIIMDSDVELSEGVIDSLIEVLRNDEKAGLAVPRLCYSDGSVQKSTDEFPTVFTKLFRLFFLKFMESRENRHENRLVMNSNIREVDYAISAMWLFKRELLEKVGLLDENILYAPEDVDYCLRTWKAGYKVLYVPDVSVIHDAQEISRGMRMNRATIEHIKGLFYYFRKHGYYFKKPGSGYSLIH